jgi:isopenicillin N synthase-like dioxygenase
MSGMPPDKMINGVIPLLDVEPYLAGEPGALDKVARELRYAFEQVGFYYMQGHGVPRELIASMFEEAKRFHAQPAEQKERLKINEHNIGYMGMGGSMFRTSRVEKNKKPGANEAFFLRRERSPDDPDVVANKKLRGLNQWPSDLPGFRETVLQYMNTMESLGRRLVRIYAVALDLPETYFDPMFERPSIVQRLTHYPASPKRAEDEFSIAPHTDSGFMTMLAPNDMPGLSIRLPSGNWIDAPVVENAYVVNGGDILRRWTNDRFLSTPHRVTNVIEKPRYAVPFFFDPHFDTPIRCLPSCQSASDPEKYPSITYDEYAIWFATRNYEHQNHQATSEKVDA